MPGDAQSIHLKQPHRNTGSANEGRSHWGLRGLSEVPAWRNEDAVFRTVIEVGEPLGPESIPPLIDKLGLPPAANLICPTGRLIVGCLGSLGQQQTPAVTVEPGTYRVNFTCDDEEENKHMELEARSDYPPGEGPDWRLVLNRVQP